MKLPQISRLQAVSKNIFLVLKGFRRVFPKSEKAAIVALLFIAFISLFFWVKEVRSEDAGSSSAYSEGWLVKDNNLPDLGRLTNAGLTRYLVDGSIGADIADKWDVSDDHLTYTFHINNHYSAPALLDNISQYSDNFGGAEVSAPDERTIVFKLKQPINFFLSTTTKPIFPFGPYVIESQTPQNITLVSRKDYHLEKPKVRKIIIRLYKDEKSLKKALDTGKVLATSDLSQENPDMKTQRITLPRFISVFFNTRKAPFDNKDLRKKIIGGENVAGDNLKVKLVATTAEEVKSQLEGVKNKLESQGITVDIVEQDTSTLLSGAIADRDYNLLLFGIDYGYGEDPYPFWHSSRVDAPGNNFTGLKNKELDWKLEDARTTSNLDERANKIKEAKEIIKNEYVEIPVKAQIMLYQSSPRVENNELKYLADPLDRFNYISEWTVN